MARIPWILTDPVAAETYAFEINPRDGASPTNHKTLTTKTNSAPGPGGTLLFEGADEPSLFEASGILLTEGQYMTLLTWWDKRVLLTLQDDLGFVFTIYLQNFDPKRAPKHSHPWRHTYSISAVIVR